MAMRFIRYENAQAGAHSRVAAGGLLLLAGFGLFPFHQLLLYAGVAAGGGYLAAKSLVGAVNRDNPHGFFEFLLNTLVVVVISLLPPSLSPEIARAGLPPLAFMFAWSLALVGGLYAIPSLKVLKAVANPADA